MKSLRILFFTFAAITALIFLSGCSGGSGSGGGGDIKPQAEPILTKQATHAISSVQKVFELKSNAKKARGSANGSTISGGLFTTNLYLQAVKNGLGDSSKPKPLDSELTARKIEKELQNLDCKFNIPIDEDPSKGVGGNAAPGFDLKDFRMSIDGPTCPLEAVVEVSGVQQTQNSLSARFTMTFKAKTAEMQKELTAKSLQLSGSINGTFTQLPDNGMSATMKGTLSGNGILENDQSFSTTTSYAMDFTMTPPKEGTGSTSSSPFPGIGGPETNGGGVNMPLDFFKMRMDATQRYDFQDTATTLASTVDMKGMGEIVESYSINGRSVTREEYNAYASEIEFPGMGKPGDSGGSTNPPDHSGPVPSDHPARCILQVFDAAEVSLANLQQAIQQGSAPKGFPLQTMQSCQENLSTDFKYLGSSVKMSIFHAEDYMFGQVDRLGTVTPIYIQREASERQATQIQDLTALFQCQPVAACP